MEERKCHNCNRVVKPESQLYVLKIEMFASPEVIIPKQKPGTDAKAEMEALLKQMETIGIEEATEQVYESYQYNLCGECRERFHKQLKRAKQVGFGI